MAIPKKVKKNINIKPRSPQEQYPDGYNGLSVPNRRKELGKLLTEDGTFLPKSVLHEDMDSGMLEFVQNDLETTSSGKKIPVIDRILTLQRWGEFSQTWSFSTEDKNVELPFIVIIRKPDVQYGTNPSLQYTIPDRKQFHFAKVPTWDGNRKGVDIYTIPQPIPVDISYDIKITCNRMRELNQFNKTVMQKFSSRQAYTFVKGHYIPIVMQSIGDESKIDTEDRRYYQQSYQFQLQGFLLDEEEFEVKPAINRSLVLYGFDEQNRKREKKNLGEENPDKVRTVIDFDDVTTVKTIQYVYKNDITVMRTSNIDGITFSINGVILDTPIQVKGGDTLTITITKTNPGAPSKLIIQERLVR